MIPPPPRSTRTAPLFPYTTLFRSPRSAAVWVPALSLPVDSLVVNRSPHRDTVRTDTSYVAGRAASCDVPDELAADGGCQHCVGFTAVCVPQPGQETLAETRV